MKVHELMVGNWIKSNGIELQITAQGILYFNRKDMDVRAIPLTEEWLKKFGFKKTIEERNVLSKWDEYKYYHLNTYIRNDLHDKNFELYYRHNRITMPFNYVHQLQNLYFAFTGKELKIK